MKIDSEQIRDIAVNVWNATFGLELVEFSVPEHSLTAGAMTSCVLISGAWKGAVTVECLEPLAKRLAGMMFDMPLPEVTHSEVTDALGELANMCGGNFKALLPTPSILSLPAVVEGSHDRLSIPGSRVIQRIGFSCEGEPVVVTVHASGL